MGFSRAFLWNSEIWGCHSEAGIVAWQLDQPEKPLFALRPADLAGAAPRNLEPLSDSQLIFSAGSRLMTLTRSEGSANPLVSPAATGLSGEVIAILPETTRVVIVLRDGAVQVRSNKTLELLREEKRCTQVAAAALLPWLSSTRLLLATEDGPLLCIGLDDDLVTQYLSPYRGLKSLAAAADLIAALAPDRQRIILWNSWEPRHPAADIFIPSAARHRAADLTV
jgi:hypothetical protein